MLFIIMGLLFFGIAAAHVASPVNINTADVKQLITLKGIGPKKAGVIVANRKQIGSFHSVNDLTRIKGIGKAFLQRLLKGNPRRIAIKN